MISNYSWSQLYQAALLETDWSKMKTRIEAAKSAIEDRRKELSLDRGDTPEELHAMTDALRSLADLRNDFDAWTQKKWSPAS